MVVWMGVGDSREAIVAEREVSMAVDGDGRLGPVTRRRTRRHRRRPHIDDVTRLVVERRREWVGRVDECVGASVRRKRMPITTHAGCGKGRGEGAR